MADDERRSHTTEPDHWKAAFDHISQKWYYYSAETGERSWSPPLHWIPNEDRPEESKDEYYYKDAYGKTQGPFTKQRLISWRGSLPMDLEVFSSPHDITKNNNDDQLDNKDTLQPHCYSLAEVTGDLSLLNQWRENFPEIAARGPCSAPPAAHFEWDIQHQDNASEQHKDSFGTLAEAALAGLPDGDEVKRMAMAAVASGYSLQDALQLNIDNTVKNVSGSSGSSDPKKQGEEYIATVLHSSGRGKVQEVGDASYDVSLYSDFGAWLNPESVDEQMKKAKERGKRKLQAEEIRALKQRKKERKETKLKSWLLSD